MSNEVRSPMHRISIIIACLAASSAFASPLPNPEKLEAALLGAFSIDSAPSTLRSQREEMAAAFASGDCAEAMDLAKLYDYAARHTQTLATFGTAPEHQVTANQESEISRPANADRVDAYIHELTIGRSEGLVASAECIAKTGTKREAIEAYVKALRLIPASETALWERAANGLWGLLGIE